MGSVEAFKRTLLNVRSIAVGDPNRGAPVGSYVIALFDRLGIGSKMNWKIRLIVGGQECQAVVRGDAEIGFSQMIEIIASPDVDLVGPLPREIQYFTILTGAMPMNAQQRAAGKALLEFLTSPGVVSVFKSKGLEPD